MKLFTVLAMFALFFLCAHPGHAARVCQCGGACSAPDPEPAPAPVPAPEPAAIPDVPPALVVRPVPAIPVPGACSPPAACAAACTEACAEADHLDQATARHAPLRRALKSVWSHRPGLLIRHQ